jgi:hypothetical protein
MKTRARFTLADVWRINGDAPAAGIPFAAFPPAPDGARHVLARPILAIDPGASGGAAWQESSGGIGWRPLPATLPALAVFLSLMRARLGSNAAAVVENVGTYRPGNSAPAACTFARHCGNIDGILVALDFQALHVFPKEWQAAIGPLSKDKRARKLQIRDAMRAAYWKQGAPRITLATADALGILHFARMTPLFLAALPLYRKENETGKA